MGKVEPDKCVFCKCDLEELTYENDFQGNGERASDDFGKDLEICKDCLTKLKLLLGIKVKK